MKITPEHITQLKPNEIFVFGSNLAGIHGAGAAKFAHKVFGAEFNIGVGPTGRCYAIPTKDEDIWTLPLNRIQGYIVDFLEYANEHPELTFLVTPVGCGLAGWTPDDIAPFFNNHPINVILPLEFHRVLCK
jgi:hypothetical protein